MLTYIQNGTKEYKRASFALFLGGFVTFSILYTTQPLMPEFSREFHVSAPIASLALSLSTGVLAVTMLLAASISDAIGKKQIMTISMLFTSILGLFTAFTPSFVTLLIFRAVLGVFIAGVPSIAMGYIAEEFDPRGIGKIMGLYISGTSIGGMAGRIITGILTDFFSWRISLMATGVIALFLSILFWFMIPSPRHAVKKAMDWNSVWEGYKTHLFNKKLMALITLGFLFMGSFVTLYNYIGFLLMGSPYHLSQTLIGFIFIVYIFGTFSSVYMGKKADLYGNALVIKISIALTVSGAALTLVPALIGKIIGISIFTFGFFASHSIASAWVGERARSFKAQASSLYLLFYYLGSSLVGSFGGYFWTHYQWVGVISLIILLLMIAYPLVMFAQKEPEKVHAAYKITK